ncbi:MAG TPA: enoyl-CoA hydratase-related protein [bacterium]|nr:enoyl-CoA hydratase-related protein [bacterium]
MAETNLVDLRLSEGGRIATLTLQEPRLNVLSTPVLDGLIQAAVRLQAMEDLRLVIVTGAGGRAFIGGADLQEMAEFTPERALIFIDKIHKVCHLLRTLPVPSIARVQGFCLGAGMEVAASCDLRIGSEDSRYGMPEVQVGLPSVVEARLLPTLIGWGRTRELLYTGAVIDAREAERIGFLERVAPAEGLDAAIQPWLDAILAAEPGAIRAQKRLIEGWLETGIAAGVQHSIDVFSQSFHTDAPNRRLREALQRLRGR